MPKKNSFVLNAVRLAVDTPVNKTTCQNEVCTFREETFAEEIFAEFNFADFSPICEINFRENLIFFSFSEKRGSKWEIYLSENCSSAKLNSANSLILTLSPAKLNSAKISSLKVY